MNTQTKTNLWRGRCWKRSVLYPLIALFASGAALAGTTDAGHAKTTYTVIQLAPGGFAFPSINAKGQVVFNDVLSFGVYRAKFYDGKHVRDIGTLGGPSTFASALNDLGQVTGSSAVNADGSITHAFRWSQATGMLDLSRSGQGNSAGVDINNKGQVAGSAVFNAANRLTHGFFWTPQTGMLDIGAFGPNLTSGARALNDAGTVTGSAEAIGGLNIAFRWTKAEGIREIGTLPGRFTDAYDINAAGHIVGESPFPGAFYHAYLWTPHRGLLDLGSGSNPDSSASAVNDHDVVIGSTFREAGPGELGFVWTHAMGLHEFKPQSPDSNSSLALGLNNRGQVVGSIDGYAFVWSRAEGLVDLNTRIRGAPAGLKLFLAYAISDNGSIVANANTGLVLLVPRCGCNKIAPTVGAITLNGTARASAQLSFSAAFKDIDVTDHHKANWSWGDGSQEVGTVNERDGAGNVSGQHVYAAPGIYTAALTVTDSSGQSTTVQRKITVTGTGAYIAGEGWFMSPPHASRMAVKRGGIASFAVLSPVGNGASAAQDKASIEFSAAGIDFRSEQIDAQSIRGGSVQYSGRGSVNGSGGYSFILNSVSGTSNGRVRIRIWHYEPGAKAEVVDYDNQLDSSASSTDREGALIGEGAITIQSD